VLARWIFLLWAENLSEVLCSLICRSMLQGFFKNLE
jgi:hypothetical protein